MRQLLLLFVFLPIAAHTQVTLRPWVEGFGSTNGQQLGKYVTGITPSANLPYRAAISKVGSTGIYRLNSASDTSVQQVFFGENLLTGDLNNDGFKDVVVSKTVNNYDTVFIYWGTSTGIDTLNPLKIPGENQYDALLPGCIGDLNNDGTPDLILRAPNFPSLFQRGKVYVFLSPITGSIPDATIVGDTTRSGIGIAVSVGNLNNDGLNDLIVRGSYATPGQGRYRYINIYWGAGIDTLGLQLGLQMRTDDSAERGLACFDANGDGKDDLLWTVVDATDSGRVKVFIHYGRPMFDTIPDMKLRNPGVGTFGFAVANAGDMNGDGYNDVIVGCPDASITSGFVLVYSGGPNIDPFVDATRSRTSGGYFGRSISSLGDVTGDGLADIIIGAPRDPFFPPSQFEKGYWGIFKGDTSIHVTSVGETSALPVQFSLGDAYPNPFNPSTTLPYEARTLGVITLTVTDILGRLVTTLIQSEHQPGRYTATFDGAKYASGVYYYRMDATTKQGTRFTQTKKFILIK